MVTSFFMKFADSSNPRECSSTRRSNWLQSWPFGELEMRNKVFQKDRTKIAKQLRNYDEFTLRKRIKPDSWKSMNSFCNRERIFLPWISFYRLWMFLRASKARSIFIGIRGWRENDWNDAKYGSYCGTSWWRTLILVNQFHFLITVNVKFIPMLQATSSSRCHKQWSVVLSQSRLDDKWWADSMEFSGYLRHVEDPEVWTKIGKAAQKREKLKCAIETQKFDNARRLTGIYFINREDGEYKETIKNAWRKLEVPKDAAMSCKEGTKTTRRFRKLKRKVVNPTILETTSGIISTERSWRSHRRQRGNWCLITIWFTNLFLCFKPWKLRMRKQQSTRDGRSSKRFQLGSWTK